MPLPANELASEGIAILSSLKPASVAAGTATLGPFSAAQAARVLFLLDIGVISGGSTIDAKVQASATSGGTYADVSGAAITQVTVSAAGVLVLIEVKAETLASAGQGPFLKLVITVGTAACILAAKAFTAHVDYAPAALLNTTIAQTIVV